MPRGLPGDHLRVRVDDVSAATSRARCGGGAGRRSRPPRASVSALLRRLRRLRLPAPRLRAQLRLKEDDPAGVPAPRRRRPGTRPSPCGRRPTEGWRTRATLPLPRRAGRAAPRASTRRAPTGVVDRWTAARSSRAAMSRAAVSLRDALAERPDWAGPRPPPGARGVAGRRRAGGVARDRPRPRRGRRHGVAGRRGPGPHGLWRGDGEGRRRRFLALRASPTSRSTVHGLRLRAHVRVVLPGQPVPGGGPRAGRGGRGSPEGRPVLDLYAGVGLFALPLGGRSRDGAGLELSPVAVDDARANAEAAGLGHVRIQQGRRGAGAPGAADAGGRGGGARPAAGGGGAGGGARPLRGGAPRSWSTSRATRRRWGATSRHSPPAGYRPRLGARRSTCSRTRSTWRPSSAWSKRPCDSWTNCPSPRSGSAGVHDSRRSAMTRPLLPLAAVLALGAMLGGRPSAGQRFGAPRPGCSLAGPRLRCTRSPGGRCPRRGGAGRGRSRRIR